MGAGLLFLLVFLFLLVLFVALGAGFILHYPRRGEQEVSLGMMWRVIHQHQTRQRLRLVGKRGQ